MISTHLKSTFVTNEFFMGKIQEVLNYYNNVGSELTFAKTNEMINEQIPRLVNLAVNRDREIAPTNVPGSSTATTSIADIKHQLYLIMKSNHQYQAANPKLWDILKAKFEKPLMIVVLNAFRKRHHGDHHYDAAPPGGGGMGQKSIYSSISKRRFGRKVEKMG
ncbi:hypothetical protein Tco_0117430 [Tanacetum coccineum]